MVAERRESTMSEFFERDLNELLRLPIIRMLMAG